MVLDSIIMSDCGYVTPDEGPSSQPSYHTGATSQVGAGAGAAAAVGKGGGRLMVVFVSQGRGRVASAACHVAHRFDKSRSAVCHVVLFAAADAAAYYTALL